MNQTHIHLMITHLPIIGSVLGAMVLTYGLWTKTTHTQISAYLLFIASSVGAIVSYLTGEAAEETIEDLGGISKNIIEQHEEFALIALFMLLGLGIISLTALILTLKKSSYTRVAALTTLLISVVSFGVIAWTGYLGGKIRHTEISTPAVFNDSVIFRSPEVRMEPKCEAYFFALCKSCLDNK
jgi:uncharacterized membrane protein